MPAASLVLLACSIAPTALDPFGRPYDRAPQIRETELKDCEPSAHDTRPRVVRAIKPLFPIGQFYAGNRAVVTVPFIVKVDGTVSAPKARGGEFKWFESHALFAVSDWTFHPATKDGVAIEVSCKYTFIF